MLKYFVFPLGFPASHQAHSYNDESTVVYIYDENFVNVSSYRVLGGYSDYDGLFSRGKYDTGLSLSYHFKDISYSFHIGI